MIRLWPVDSYLHANLAVLPLATLCRMPGGKPVSAALRDVVLEINRRLGSRKPIMPKRYV